MNTINVVSAIVDGKQLTLYKTDGETYTIPQGDPRLKPIVDKILPILARKEVAVVDLDDNSNPYKEYEEKSGGLVRFFRVAKSWLKSRLGAKEEETPKEETPILALTIGQVPTQTLNQVHQQIVSQIDQHTGVSQASLPASQFLEKSSASTEQAATQKLMSAVDEIISKAVPASSPEFTSKPVGGKHEETVVAVVGNQVIEGVERLKPQISRASSPLGSTKGMDAFMKRVAAVASKRRHSVEDLLRFLERGDLPIADDGSIVIYKVLRKKTLPNYPEHTYVDCHTGNVPQRVGSYVCMDPSLVDPNRRNECSNGLHVARRAYIGGFGGDVVVLAKVAPEDVIAVPDYDANKMRVCGYHILFELSDKDFKKLKANHAFTDNEEAKILLGRALTGDHPPVLDRVEITGQKGSGIKVTLMGEPPAAEPVKPKTKVAKVAKVEQTKEPVETPKAEALPLNGDAAAPVDPKSVAAAAAVITEEVETRAAKAKRLWADFKKANKKTKRQAAQAVLDHKKAVKLGWKALGLPEDAGTVLAEAVKA